MKKYFAKWLPVEGEIKEGDKVRYSKGQLGFPDAVYDVLDNVKELMSIPSVGGYGIYNHISTEISENGKNIQKGAYLKIGYNILLKDIQKAKLFLCSRDIQVGDIPYGYDDMIVDKIGNELAGFHIKEVDNDFGYWITNIFKKIGEISPNALSYVKEGDEFGEEQVDIIEQVLAERVGNSDTDEYYTNHVIPKRWLNDNSDWWTDGEIKKYSTIVKIKGPCGHFH